MFADETVGVVDFASSWKKKRDVVNTGCQTRDVSSKEGSCQAVNHDEIGVQTESSDRDMDIINEPDSPALTAFLHKVEPTISKLLIKNMRSTAFEGFSTAQELDSGQVVCNHTLTNTDSNSSVTGLSWNATGSVVAASYGKYDHEDWCTHKSSLRTWNLNKRLVTSEKPDAVVELSSCLMTISFHPQEPALIAGANFNGEVMVWDLSRESDVLVASSGKGGDSHTEPISTVQWYQQPGKRKIYHVLSCGYDGKILIWKLDKDKGILNLDSGFMILASSMPRSVKVKSSKKHQEMGVTSISFNQVDDSIFYIGAESGGMFKCTTNTTPQQMGDGDLELGNPVTLSFLPHQGPVYSVSSSPFHRNIFLSCSSDTSLRLHSALQTQPLMTIEPSSGYLYSARWSPNRPLVLVAATQDGQLLIYDLKRSQTTPVQCLQASANKQACFTAEFNYTQKQYLATGDAGGVVKIWQLNDELVTESAGERDTLSKLADISSNET